MKLYMLVIPIITTYGPVWEDESAGGRRSVLTVGLIENNSVRKRRNSAHCSADVW